ncbi:MAG: urea ABC transporter ATP-binding protein UrtD [Candidatus Rokubacteria bacterium]|nr:urea ABC transporter ATP-binding protein UrtD [Candidatus Rokubacteria bacterium]
MTARGSIIYLEDVTVNYDGFKALDRLNFFMDRRELRVVIGPNGAGKTTLLDVISGSVKPESGRVIFGHSTDLLPLRENQIAQLGVGRKFQTPSVFVNLTVRDNVELSLRRASKGVLAALRRRDPDEERARIARTLESVQLAGKAGWPAGALSHGEKQWLEIGMVIAQDPELLLVDEPVAGMTDEETARTGELLETIAADRSVLVIEHDMEFVRQIARQVTVLHQGTVLCEGPLGRRPRGRHGRARLPDGAQRRREDHAAQDRDGAPAGAARARALRRRRRHRLVARPAGPGRHRLRPAGAGDLPPPHGRGESADGAPGLRADRLARGAARAVPGPPAAARAQGRRAVGRRAADARDRARPPDPAEAPHARRAHRGHPALDHPRDRGRAPADQARAGAGRPAGRAVP